MIDINLVALISCILSVLNGVNVKNQMNFIDQVIILPY